MGSKEVMERRKGNVNCAAYHSEIGLLAVGMEAGVFELF